MHRRNSINQHSISTQEHKIISKTQDARKSLLISLVVLQKLILNRICRYTCVLHKIRLSRIRVYSYSMYLSAIFPQFSQVTRVIFPFKGSSNSLEIFTPHSTHFIYIYLSNSIIGMNKKTHCSYKPLYIFQKNI